MTDEGASGFGNVTPQMYATSNQSHQDLNKDSIKSIIDCFGELDEEDVIVDFGCGTGETTALMARGNVLSRSMSHKIIGLDTSRSMIEHCKKMHKPFSNSGLQFFHFDYKESEMVQDFQSRWRGKLKLITCFTVMHWVEHQARALEFMRSVLLPDGRGFLAMSILLGESTKGFHRRAFEALQQDDTSVLFDVLKDVQYKHLNLKFEEGTNITVDNQISDKAYLGLLATHHFKVKKHEVKPVAFKVTKAYEEHWFNTKVLPLYAVMTKNHQDLFCKEFTNEVRKLQNQEHHDGNFTFLHGNVLVVFATT